MFKKALSLLPVLLTVLFAVVLIVTFVSRQNAFTDMGSSEVSTGLWSNGNKLNINTANAAMLRQLPGLHPKTAARIVEYRDKNGPFRKVEDLLNVKGVSSNVLNEIIDYITTGDVT